MPIYEYRCARCGHQFDVTHAVGKTIARCEKCGGAVRRVFTSVGIIFKGSGFHVNDYRKTPASADGLSSSGAPGRGERDRPQGGDAKAGSDGKEAGGGKSAPATEASSGSGSSEKNGKARSAAAPSQGAGTKSS